MAKKYLDDNGLLYFWGKLKALFNSKADASSVPSKTSDLTNDSGYITISDVPPGSTASSTTPKMDGTAATGSENAFARGDHVHPHDSSKADAATTLSGYGITDAYTKSEVDAKVSSVYKPAGSVSAVSGLGSLVAANEGKVYNFTASFTTTSDFVEGSGKDYPAGTNVVIINTATSGNAVYKYDVLMGLVDLSGYLQTSDVTEISNSEIDTIVAS